MTLTVTLLVLCNNLNYQHSPRCMAPVAEIHQTYNGFHGTLESGVKWKQTRITPEVMLFEMEEVKYYVFKDRIIYAQ